MKINYIFRSKEYNAFSIENVFKNIGDELNKTQNIEMTYVPVAKYSLKMFIENSLFALKQRGDILHITGDIHYVCFLMSRKKTILTVHDIRAIEFLKNNKLKLILYKLLWVIIPSIKCKYITTISEKSKKEFCKIAPWARNKVLVISNPIDPEYEYRPKKFCVKKPRLLMIGTKENKNHLRMLEAIKDIDCIVDIIGKIPENEEKYLISNKISYENSIAISDEDLRKKYYESDIVMFVSTYEGFGVPIIEAQAIGRVVITSNLEPMNIVSGDGAVLVDPYNVNSIRGSVMKVINDEEFRNEIILRGLENSKKYSVKIIATKYLELYNKIYSQKM